MTDIDYPAAHSTDTRWFAVDQDGHVALLESGTSGAVPNNAASYYADEEQMEEMFKLLEPLAKKGRLTEVIFEKEALFGTKTVVGPRRGQPTRPPHGREMSRLMFIDSLDDVRAEIDRGEAIPVRASEGAAVLIPKLTKAKREKLHDKKICKGCIDYWHQPDIPSGTTFLQLAEEAEQFFDEIDDDPSAWDPVRMGFFAFEHMFDDEIAGPYNRISRPAKPIKVSQLPAALRKQAQKLKLGFSFNDVLSFQPAEYARCFTWYPYYLCEDERTVRPEPGNEKEGRKRFDEAYGKSKEFVFDGSPWNARKAPLQLRKAPEQAAPGNGRREFHYQDARSNKFWAITLDGTRHEVHFGRIGTRGQIKEKSFSSPAKARSAYEDLIASKLAKGYVEVTAGPGDNKAAKKKAPAKRTTSKKTASKKTASKKKPVMKKKAPNKAAKEVTKKPTRKKPAKKLGQRPE